MSHLRSFALALLAAFSLTAGVGAAPVVIDARTAPDAAAPLPFPIGGRSPSGHALSANTKYFTLDGRPWFPVMGEFHFSRYPADEWEPELRKIRAGGVDVVSTYVFWLHHEEAPGQFDWRGQRDLRRFVEACQRCGLKVWLRIGPWVHSESRNGGLPDWLVQTGIPLRQNDPRYLAYVTRWYGQVARQVHGLFWQEDGPIIGLQLENEYHPEREGIEHMRRLRELALAAGMRPPFFSATGWDGAAVPPTDFLPMFGGYTEQFWSGSLAPLPPNQNFFFTPIRAEDNVMGDLTPKNAVYQSKYDGFPFLTAELGAGMAASYHRRPTMTADDSTAAAVVKLGSGVNGLGYYMYHGGTNPPSRLPMNETQAAWNGYNDMEAESYDWQSPLSEFGEMRETFRTLKTLHLFLHAFGSELAQMSPRFAAKPPAGLSDTATPRVAVRADADHAFIFINNHQRNWPLPAHPDFQVDLRLRSGDIRVPDRPITLPADAYPIWPVNLEIGGARLRYATAQPICRLDAPATLVFFAWPGIAPEFAFAPGTVIEAAAARVGSGPESVRVTDIAPGPAVAFRIGGRSPVDVVVLTRAEALDLWKARLGGRERLIMSPANMSVDGNAVHLAAGTAGELNLGVYPALGPAPAGFRRAPRTGIFESFHSDLLPPSTLPATVKQVRVAESAPPVRVSEPPRAVAIAPLDADFSRAAVWILHVPADLPPRTLLDIDYAGDVARVYAGDRFVDDNFYHGVPWSIGLWRFTPAERAAGLTLKILPLRRDAPVFIDPRLRPNFGSGSQLLRLKSVTIRPQLEATFQAAGL